MEEKHVIRTDAKGNETHASTFKKQSTKIVCAVCKSEVDFLLGDDAAGGVRGCEVCWKPSQTKPESDTMPKVSMGASEQETGLGSQQDQHQALINKAGDKHE